MLRRIIGGDRDASLLPGLDPVRTAVTGQVLAQLAQPPDAPAHEAMTSVTATIAALTGEEAIRVLADAAEPEPAARPALLRALDTGLRGATTETPNWQTTPAQDHRGRRDLARATLVHLAATASTWSRSSPGPSRPSLRRPRPGHPHRRRPRRPGPADRVETDPQRAGRSLCVRIR